MTVRVIPRLDIKGPNLVKGVHLEGLRVLGKPEEFAREYYQESADELIYMDVVASLYGRNSLLDVIRRTSSEIFIPLTVGGGLRSVADMREVLRAGADKIALNTAAHARPELITEAARALGSSSVVVSIEAVRDRSGRYYCYTDNGREPTGREAESWAKAAEDRGAGELMLTSVDREGTGRGFDAELIGRISSAVSVPVIASGGAGRASDVVAAVTSGADAVALASVLHYGLLQRMSFSPDDYSQEGNIEFRRTATSPGSICPASLGDVKAELQRQGVEVRP